MKITASDFAKIDAIIKDRADKVTYECIIPASQQENVKNALLDHWNGLAQMHPDYLDDLSDGPDIEAYLHGAGVDVDAIMDASEHVEFETAILGWAHEISGPFASFSAIRVGYFRAIVRDLYSGWENLYRKALEEVLGEDSMSTGDALDWEIED